MSSLRVLSLIEALGSIGLGFLAYAFKANFATAVLCSLLAGGLITLAVLTWGWEK